VLKWGREESDIIIRSCSFLVSGDKLSRIHPLTIRHAGIYEIFLLKSDYVFFLKQFTFSILPSKLLHILYSLAIDNTSL